MTNPSAYSSVYPRATAAASAWASRRAGVRESTAAAPANLQRASLLLLALFGVAAALLHQPAGAQRFPVTDEQRQIADKTATAGVPLSELAPNAPSNYTIKRGDTLWGIATLYLKSPWRWPELWGMNREQIRNPHLIYPGQTLGLVKTADGRAQLVLGGAASTAPAPAPAAAPAPAPAPVAEVTAVPTVRLSPRAREVGSGDQLAISSIPNNLIEPFLSQPRIVAARDLDQYPRIVATQQDRVNLGLGDIAFARGIIDPKVENYNVLRPAHALYDADDTSHSHPIAYEAVFLGTARVTKPGEVTTLLVTSSKLEIGIGDRLVPVTHQELVNYAPHRLDKDVGGSIISVYEGLDSVGAGSIVTLNRGRNEGLEVGHVIAVVHNGHGLIDNTQYAGEAVLLPDEYIGTAFVFRVFDGISYALLTSANGPIKVGDRIAPPEGAAVKGATAMNAPSGQQAQ